MTRYLILISYPRGVWGSASPEQQQAWLGQHEDFARAAGENMLAGEALVDPDLATTLRHDEDGAVVLSDGPFQESIEVLGGLYLVQAPDLDQVVAWASLLPDGYTLEIRPVAQMD